LHRSFVKLFHNYSWHYFLLIVSDAADEHMNYVLHHLNSFSNSSIIELCRHLGKFILGKMHKLNVRSLQQVRIDDMKKGKYEKIWRANVNAPLKNFWKQLLTYRKSAWFLRQNLKSMRKGINVKPVFKRDVTKGKLVTFLKIRFIILLKMFMTGLVFAFEYALDVVVQTVRKHGGSDYHFDSTIDLQASLKDTGSLPSILKILSPEFAVTSQYNNTINLTHCLPKPPESSPIMVYISIGVLYVVLFLLTWLSESILAYRSNILLFFYSKKVEIVQVRRFRRI